MITSNNTSANTNLIGPRQPQTDPSPSEPNHSVAMVHPAGCCPGSASLSLIPTSD